MNKLQAAIVWLAVIEVIIGCILMPVFLFRAQELELSRKVREQQIQSTDLTAYQASNFFSADQSGLSIEQKIDIANRYDNTVSSIYLEKGEKYTANQICSIGAGELQKIATYYKDVSPLMQRLLDMNVFEPIQACGIFLEEQSHEESGSIGYADVETVDEVDVDMNSLYISGDNEVRVEALMYINSSEPDQAFIVWQINYYNLKEDTTLFLLFDDETGKFLSITGSMAGFEDEENHSLYDDSSSNAALIKEYYQKEDAGTLEIIEE